MPAQEISEDALKLMVAQYGVRGTARMLEMDTQETNAFHKRVERAGWCQEPDIAPMIAKNTREAQSRPVVAMVSPMQALAAKMKEDAIMGRSHALTAGRNALEQVAQITGKDLLEPGMADLALKWTKQHATAAGYGANDAAARVDLRFVGDRSKAETIEADWSEVAEGQGFVECSWLCEVFFCGHLHRAD
jgi:hypothetical protein